MTQEWPFPIEDTASAQTVLKESLPEAIESVATEFAGATEPSPTFAYQRWIDTANGLVKQRNAANSAWVVVRKLFADAQASTVEVFSWTLTATTTIYLLLTDAATRIDEVLVSVAAPTTSNGTDHWTIMVANATDTLDLMAAAFDTNGSDFAANTPQAMGIDQNNTIATAGKRVAITFTKAGSATDLTAVGISVRLTRAV